MEERQIIIQIDIRDIQIVEIQRQKTNRYRKSQNWFKSQKKDKKNIERKKITPINITVEIEDKIQGKKAAAIIEQVQMSK